MPSEVCKKLREQLDRYSCRSPATESKVAKVRYIGLFLSIAFCFTTPAYSAITVTSPSSEDRVESADDYASISFQDPWDMDYRTDPGWFIFSKTSDSNHNLTNISFTNSIFSATATTTDPKISVLDTGVPGTSFLGKIGTNYPIDADKYTVLAMRMRLNKDSSGQLFWSRNTIYDDLTQSQTFSTYMGWHIYTIKIPNLGITPIPNRPGDYPWSGTFESLRFDPASSTVGIDIDWINLVNDDSSLYRTIKWTGSAGNVDICLDDDTNEGNGILGKVAENVSGTSYQLYVGALSSGVNYYVGLRVRVPCCSAW